MLIEDSALAVRKLSEAISKLTRLQVDIAQSYSDAERLLDEDKSRYKVAVVDLVLPDAPDGEAVDLVCRHEIAVIVLTSNISEGMRDRIVAKPIVDYLSKQTVASVEYAANLVRRVVANHYLKVLVVDDSDAFRSYLSHLLQVHCLQVLNAENAEQAMKIVQQHPDIRLMLFDYEMPGMNGVQLTAAVRARVSRARACIIGVTGSDNPYIGAQFLKAGADDILRKPFLVEEFYARVIHHLDTLDHIRLMERLANRDYLTNLYNRRYLYLQGNAMAVQAQREHTSLSVAVVDIDHFKRVNDQFGHEIGDRALISVAECLVKCVGSGDLVARMGGEEFCIVSLSANDDKSFFERICRAVERLDFHDANGRPIALTVSIGVNNQIECGFERMLSGADGALYRAKDEGRNRVVVAPRDWPNPTAIPEE